MRVRAAIERYLNALSVVDGPCATPKQLHRVCKPTKFHQRWRRCLNLLHSEAAKDPCLGNYGTEECRQALCEAPPTFLQANPKCV
jgi:hypothetical protein